MENDDIYQLNDDNKMNSISGMNYFFEIKNKLITLIIFIELP